MNKEQIKKEFKSYMRGVSQPDKIQQHQEFTDRDMIDFWEDVLEPMTTNWWLTKLDQVLEEQREELIEKIENLLKTPSYNKDQSYETSIKEIISIIKSKNETI